MYKNIFSPFDSAKNCKFFPPDFFTDFPIEKQKSQSIETKKNEQIVEKIIPEKINTTKSSKSITIDLQQEYEEDKEILDLLEGKRNYIFFYFFYI